MRKKRDSFLFIAKSGGQHPNSIIHQNYYPDPHVSRKAMETMAFINVRVRRHRHEEEEEDREDEWIDSHTEPEVDAYAQMCDVAI